MSIFEGVASRKREVSARCVFGTALGIFLLSARTSATAASTTLGSTSGLAQLG